MSFDDVEPQAKVDFTNAATATFVSFDGLTLSLSFAEKDSDYWMTVNATGTPQPEQPAAPGSTPKLKPDIVKEAKEINTVVAGWAYRIPRYKGQQLTAPLDDLFKPVGTPPSPGTNQR
jgi:hypothetical protein